MILKVNATNFKRPVNIKSIPTTKLNVCNNSYKVVSAIFRYSIQKVYHYSCYIGDKKSGWIHVDDLNIQRQRWPNNAKDAYMFFLKRIDLN